MGTSDLCSTHWIKVNSQTFGPWLLAFYYGIWTTVATAPIMVSDPVMEVSADRSLLGNLGSCDQVDVGCFRTTSKISPIKHDGCRTDGNVCGYVYSGYRV